MAPPHLRSYCERLHPASKLLNSEWIAQAEDAGAGESGMILLIRQQRRATVDAWATSFLANTALTVGTTLLSAAEVFRDVVGRQ